MPLLFFSENNLSKIKFGHFFSCWQIGGKLSLGKVASNITFCIFQDDFLVGRNTYTTPAIVAKREEIQRKSICYRVLAILVILLSSLLEYIQRYFPATTDEDIRYLVSTKFNREQQLRVKVAARNK